MYKIAVPLNDDSPMPLGITATLDQFVEKIRRILEPNELLVDNVTYFTTYSVNVLVAAAFSASNRVFLVGDAIHVQSPKTGQGLNLGFGDVYNLFWKLHLYDQGLASLDVLDTFDSERREIIARIQAYSDSTTRLQMGRNVPGGATDTATIMRELAYATNRALRMSIGTDIEYSPNVINSTEFCISELHPRIRIGQIALNGTLYRKDGSEVWLHDQFKEAGRFYILVFVGDPTLSSATVAELCKIHEHLSNPNSFVNRFRLRDSSPLIKFLWVTTTTKILHHAGELQFLSQHTILVDKMNRMHVKYGATEGGAAFVLRPDEHVGASVTLQDFSTLEDYFDGFLLARS
ncbi:FAD binding domain-containing protein [Jimgerdemannia flammicorona]|uniref:FAD binding domain-containing protein n=1 Tax=Jimgerdemannia flammicorona TaxID=994334 RepID=A0A433QY29_9FUNG|nr:FAD binding domain-containing protein [Jimgerdemannia flammicorona]